MQVVRAFFLSLLAVTVMAAAPPLGAAQGASSDPKRSIKKCQDASGRWHYGDAAADECERSKITVLSTEGTVKREIAAPLTEAELKASETRKTEEAQERQAALEQKRRDDRLLATYGLEQDIIYVRDRKLAQIEQNIKASEGTIASLRKVLERMEKQGDAKNIEQTKAQIERHEAVIATKRKEQEEIRSQAENDLERYRELKRGKTGASAEAANP